MTMTTKFDTSGIVRFDGGTLGVISWEGVGQLGGAFTQGYIEALMRSAWGSVEFIVEWWDKRGAYGDKGPLAFSDLARETLAWIMEDCAKIADLIAGLDHRDGKDIWTSRCRGFPGPGTLAEYMRTNFPPLTPYLGDDGKVYLREASA